MSILNSHQRAVIRADTGIDPLVIDRVVEAYDKLLADDNFGYRHTMGTAIAQLGLPIPIPEKERPTAVDKVKTIVIKAIADERHWDFKRTAAWLQEAATK
jgi:hypothetical protein